VTTGEQADCEPVDHLALADDDPGQFLAEPRVDVPQLVDEADVVVTEAFRDRSSHIEAALDRKVKGVFKTRCLWPWASVPGDGASCNEEKTSDPFETFATFSCSVVRDV
jgi:hypothetical protein